MPNVRFFGPLGNSSGYGNAVKNFALAFSRSDVQTKFAFPSSVIDKNKDFYNSLNNYNGHTDIDFYLHAPPWSKHKSAAKYKIAYFYWEADVLPSLWARYINQVNELWVPCKLVERACRKAKFKGVIKVVPTPGILKSSNKDLAITSSETPDYVVSDSVYKFYSIFQWHERKGFKELLVSYLNEFDIDDQVLLVLKVNDLKLPNYNSNTIYRDIQNIKKRVNKKRQPRIFLSRGLLPADTISSIHKYCDCYVAPYHGEGWGVPIHNAMFSENLLITTKYGGISEWLDNSNALIINHSLGPVKNMEWSPLYGAYQNWAYPNTKHLSILMRDVYKNHKYMDERRKKLKSIADSFDIDSIAKIISREIESIKV